MKDFKIKIYNKPYQVKFGGDKLFEKYDFKKEDIKNLLGGHILCKSLILIREEEGNRMRETFIHECIHAIYKSFAYYKTKLNEEFLCNFISVHFKELSRILKIYDERIIE